MLATPDEEYVESVLMEGDGDFLDTVVGSKVACDGYDNAFLFHSFAEKGSKVSGFCRVVQIYLPRKCARGVVLCFFCWFWGFFVFSRCYFMEICIGLVL